MASEQQMRLAGAHAEGQSEAERWAEATKSSIDSAKTTASNATQSVQDTACSIKDGTCEAASAMSDSIKETGSDAAQWGRDKTDSMTESFNNATFAAQEKKEYAAGFMEQTGENLKQAFFDADESMKQSMAADTSIPGTTSLDRTNTPSFDQML